MKILKFGGKSLALSGGLETVISIVKAKKQKGENFHVVVSALDDSTDQLQTLLNLAAQNQDYHSLLTAFTTYQNNGARVAINREIQLIEKVLEGVSLVGDYSAKVKDLILAQGELIAAKVLAARLNQEGVQAQFVDARELLLTNSEFGQAQILEAESQIRVKAYFEELPPQITSIITGFIAANQHGETTTLGRNGSNYSASLFAKFLNADELQSFTHVNGIYTANPQWVENAKKIEELSYEEANEIATLGATILHAKSILPLLEAKIPLRILNTFNDQDRGTRISDQPNTQGIRALSVLENSSLISFIGRGLLGKVGIDARIFTTLARENISISIVAQGSSERGIGLVVQSDQAVQAVAALEKEFAKELQQQDVSTISATSDIAVVSIIGQDLVSFSKPYHALVSNQIVPILINNTITGKNVSVVIAKHQLRKALNIIHGEIFGIDKKINLVLFGTGTVGSVLIDQLLKSKAEIETRKNISLNIAAIVNSKKLLFDAHGLGEDWREALKNSALDADIHQIFDLAEAHHLGNLIAVDLTAHADFVTHYPEFVRRGFDLVSANKIANTKDYGFYKNLREELKKHQKEYLYETNVGAGLPLIDTIRLLHHSGENITRIRGVFSGTLSYLFNQFSSGSQNFSEVLKEAIAKGFTEPDPREDLNGNDVGRKLLILARELDLPCEFSDVRIENLIPDDLRQGPVEGFLESLNKFDPIYHALKIQQQEGSVLRYVGDLHGDLNNAQGAQLDVKLVSVPLSTALGQLKGSDSIFEIYTESYGEQPLVIQGAGAGAAVTARGVFGDILRLAEKK